MTKRIVVLAGCLAAAITAFGQADVEKRKGYLETLIEMTPESKAFNEWLEESGELPPDFDAMRSIPWLPDPLVRYEDGSRIESAEEWDAYRAELKDLFHHWVIGTMPPPPDNIEVDLITEDKQDHGTRRELEMRFGPDHQAKLWFELFIPPGDGPHPVFVTQDNHRAWALIALSRGYLCVVYAGSDSRDDTATFIDAYPDHDWSKLVRRAWAASRCIDYLEDVPEADTDRIAMTGHSRNGKMSLMAAALDERIKCVISSSSGAGGCNPARLFGEPQFGEGIELITRNFPDWFHPRWRFFVGREDKLPVDMHQLVALSAPRACLISIAVNDPVEGTWAVEHAYTSAKPVWELYGAEDKFRILWRENSHETWPTIIQRFMDWCDVQFDRGDTEFPERGFYPTDWDAWAKNAEPIDPASFPAHGTSADARKERFADLSKADLDEHAEKAREAIHMMMGAAPPGLTVDPSGYGEERDHVESLLGRSEAGRGLIKDDVMFGEYLNADVYLPAEVKREEGAKVPAILWIHPQSNPRGYVAAYRRGEQAYRTLARAGYAVFCFDQIAHGRRVEEAEHFYRDHPNWSLLGKTIRDCQAAIDRMASLPYVDADQIQVVGYAQGAFVGMHLMAIDDRVAKGYFVAPPQPFRLDTADAPTGGIAKWSTQSMLLPRMGFFIGHESHLPYDIEDLLAACAPRDANVVIQNHDYLVNADDLAASLDAARMVYGLSNEEENVRDKIVEGYNHFDPNMQAHVLEFLTIVAPSEFAAETD